MKITGPEYNMIQSGVHKVLHIMLVDPSRIQSTRDAWSAFHKAWNVGLIDGNTLYKSYNDAHIETALKKIFNISNNS